jgi:preprotein translocase subunit SecG
MWIKIIQIVLAAGLMIAILLQNKGTGLSEVFGGGGNVFRTKRGLDKILFRTTIALAIIFFVISLIVVLPRYNIFQ